MAHLQPHEVLPGLPAAAKPGPAPLVLLHVRLAGSSDLPVSARVGQGQALANLNCAGLCQLRGQTCATTMVVGCQVLVCISKGANLLDHGKVLEMIG